MVNLVKALFSGLQKSAPSGTVPVRSNGLWGMAREPYAGAWQQGMTVDPLGAITSFGAVFACITRIANDIAKMEMKARVKADGIDVDAAPTSPFWRVLRKPNTYQNRIQFIAYWIICKLLHGNAYALKLRDNRGMVFALYPLDPRRVTPMVTPGGDVYYSLGGDDLSRIPTGLVVPAREIIHDRGATIWHPLIGISPIVACAVSATQGNRIQSNSAKFFENMSRPSGMLTAPATIDDVTATRLKREFEANFGGGNIGRLAVLGDGLTYEAMTIPAEQAQLIDQLKWTVEDVARCFQVPLYKINAGPIPTAGNVETLHIQYLDAALHPYIESFEQCLTEGLEMDSVNMWMELDLDGLLRMDSLSRVEMLTKASGGAFMKPNEARQKWNLPPVRGGDALYKQQQDYSLEALAKRDATADPFGKTPAAAPTQPAAPAVAPAPEKAREVDEVLLRAAETVAQAQAFIADLVESSRKAIEQAATEHAGDAEQLRAAVGEALAGVPEAVAKAHEPIAAQTAERLEAMERRIEELALRGAPEPVSTDIDLEEFASLLVDGMKSLEVMGDGT